MDKRYPISIFLIVISIWLGVQFYVQPGCEVPLIKKITESFCIPIIILPELPAFINDSLSDGLWMMALGCSIITIWNYNLSYRLIWFYTISIIAAFSLEFGQLLNILPGTFDVSDCIATVLGGSIPLFLLIKKQHYGFTC